MKTQYSKTYAYFHSIKAYLERRSLHLRWGKNHAFYSLYNIGPYTFASFKVCWPRTTKNFGCAVLTGLQCPELGMRSAVANCKVMFLPFDEEMAAHYVCALLNSSPARAKINACLTTEAHKDIINVVHIPKPSQIADIAERLAQMSISCQQWSHQGDQPRVLELEKQIDEVAASIWGISKRELKTIQATLSGTCGTSGKRRKRTSG